MQRTLTHSVLSLWTSGGQGIELEMERPGIIFITTSPGMTDQFHLTNFQQLVPNPSHPVSIRNVTPAADAVHESDNGLLCAWRSSAGVWGVPRPQVSTGGPSSSAGPSTDLKILAKW